MEGVIQEALDQARLRVQQLDAVAVTIGPGLSLCLKVGTFFVVLGASRWF